MAYKLGNHMETMNSYSRILIASLALAVSALSTTAQSAGAPPPGSPGGAGQRPPTLPIITALDANDDGVIDADELANATGALKKLDKNSDGKLSADEFRPPRLGGPAGFPGRGAFPGMVPSRGPAAGESGRPRMERPGQAGPASFSSLPLAKSETEKKILSVLEDINQNQRRGSMSVPMDDGRLLRLLAEAIGAKHIVEIGTSVGYSGMWFCLGLQSTGGHLTTHEIDAQRAATARNNFKRADVERFVSLVEGDAHEQVAKLKEPIDLLFLDADKEGYIDYLNKLLPLVRPGGLVVAHNITPRQADPRYIKAITTNPDLETVFLNLETSGISVTLKKRFP
jgi:predicted O-methyltransferase YrrM